MFRRPQHTGQGFPRIRRTRGTLTPQLKMQASAILHSVMADLVNRNAISRSAFEQASPIRPSPPWTALSPPLFREPFVITLIE